MVEFNRNWVESPKAPKPNLGATRGLGFMTPSTKAEQGLLFGAKGLLLGATGYSGFKLVQSLRTNGQLRGHKWMASVFLASAILSFKAIKGS